MHGAAFERFQLRVVVAAVATASIQWYELHLSSRRRCGGYGFCRICFVLVHGAAFERFQLRVVVAAVATASIQWYELHLSSRRRCGGYGFCRICFVLVHGAAFERFQLEKCNTVRSDSRTTPSPWSIKACGDWLIGVLKESAMQISESRPVCFRTLSVGLLLLS